MNARTLPDLGRGYRHFGFVAVLAILMAAKSIAFAAELPQVVKLQERGSTEYGPIHYVETTERAGVTQGFLLMHARKPIGSVILFSGGDGVLNLEITGTLDRNTSFLMRVRKDFLAAGYTVAIVDTPSDQLNLREFRTTEEHATDIGGVIRYLRALVPGPVWAVGASRGTVSATNTAARLKHAGPDGLVLFSPVTVAAPGGQTSIADAGFATVSVPVLLVSHTADTCPVTPPAASQALAQRRHPQHVIEFVAISGGVPAEGASCTGETPHGFAGAERQAMDAVLPWMKAHAPRGGRPGTGHPLR